MKVKNASKNTEEQDDYQPAPAQELQKMPPLSDTSALKYKLSESVNSKIKYLGYTWKLRLVLSSFNFQVKLCGKKEKGI